MNKTTVQIAGMHCRSCEILIEEDLLSISSVDRVVVSHQTGTAEVYHHSALLDLSVVAKKLQAAGYRLGKDDKPWLSKHRSDYLNLTKAALFLVAFYFVVRGLGLFNLAVRSGGNYSSLPLVLLVGLTAGVSTCMVLVGGLVLGAAARFAEKNPQASPTQKFRPHLLFNLGRVVGFFILGGLVGSIGSVFKLSPTVLGFLTVLAGLFMLLLGIQLTEISPRLNKVNLTLPKGLYRLLGIKSSETQEYSHRGTLLLGALTFFLPCGFTQAMQIFAMSSGSFITGAITMGVFALGTTPGLLGIGGLTSVVKGNFAKPFYKSVGLAVVAMAIFNIINGYNLSGISLGGGAAASTTQADPNVGFINGTQVVQMTQSFSGYSPNKFTITKGIPVRWVINSTDQNTCASTIVVSKLNIRKNLQAGENVIEFTPTETGTIKFSCTMGMFNGAFTVVDGTGQSVGPLSAALKGQSYNGSSAKIGSQTPAVTGCGGAKTGCGGGCGGCGGRSSQNITPVTGNTENQGETQVIKATYTYSNDIQPNQFTVKAGQPVRFEIEVKEDGSGCMASVALPGLSSSVQYLQKGVPMVLEFTPTKPGKFNITCAMGVLRGVVTVN